MTLNVVQGHPLCFFERERSSAQLAARDGAASMSMWPPQNQTHMGGGFWPPQNQSPMVNGFWQPPHTFLSPFGLPMIGQQPGPTATAAPWPMPITHSLNGLAPRPAPVLCGSAARPRERSLTRMVPAGVRAAATANFVMAPLFAPAQSALMLMNQPPRNPSVQPAPVQQQPGELRKCRTLRIPPGTTCAAEDEDVVACVRATVLCSLWRVKFPLQLVVSDRCALAYDRTFRVPSVAGEQCSGRAGSVSAREALRRNCLREAHLRAQFNKQKILQSYAREPTKPALCLH